ncbi:MULTISPECIES: glycosyltransferase family 4 protein [unclassified Roseofilum]|uniref:glycosyltransferase family 4 protein n=1 Tax=unclassified Roseofilum TaxID=2620099 RepID=UPI001B26B268|nr:MULTISPECIES: glycosyltransferase family 4 protein [unclassified Roseofilum]MBP0010126.1 glycosyltransferase family 4 protein [Roseofilum sp. Belize Diploria]MBP0032067.1 glycosyltransferase family 4 protein [Roseofilum sp. Belize BBD 4]
MISEKKRVLLVSSQPIQNPASLRLMAKHPKLDILVAYCTLPEEKLHTDSLQNNPEYITKSVFDIPLLEDYPWVYVPNRSPVPNLDSAFGLINPGLIKLVKDFDCCVVYGHNYVTFWMAIAAAKLAKKPLILSTDATYIEPISGDNWKIPLKKKVLPFLYNQIADAVLVLSTASKRFIHSLGVPEDRIFITPYVVDNDAIAETARNSSRSSVRSKWNIPEDATVVVFCAKFIPRKRPQDVIEAFAKANIPNSYLLMVGDGPLADDLKAQAKDLGIKDKVCFLGLVKYSNLPEVYASSNILAFSSEYEPYGLPVNEAMICGIPVVVSDRIGAGYDLVEEGKTGFTYPCGNIDALTTIFKQTLTQPDKLRVMGIAAKTRMETWSPRENVESLVEAVGKVTSLV